MDTADIRQNSRSIATRHTRESGRARRAYLDTYAKRTRSPINQISSLEPIQSVELPKKQTVPVSLPETILNTVATASDDLVFESQPPVVGHDIFNYTSQDTKVKATDLTDLDVEDSPAEQDSSYIETISRREHHLLSDMVVRHKPKKAKTPRLTPALQFTSQPAVENTELIQPTQPLDLVEDEIFEEPEPTDQTDTDERIAANLQALYGDDSLTSQLTKSHTSASASHVRTIVASAMACGVLSVGIFAFMGKVGYQPVVAQPVSTPVIAVQVPDSQAPAGTPITTPNASAPIPVDPNHPARILISSIGVNAHIEALDLTSDGLIAVPKSWGMVGWYDRSVLPGQVGPTVLVGHYTGGYGGAFDKLKDLKNGDLITTTNGKGESVTFKVMAMNEYDVSRVPMADIVKAGSAPRLEIITCSGQWQSTQYNKRLVVTAEIVQ